MKQSDALKRLMELDRKGRHVYTTQDLATAFGGEQGRTLEATIQRLTKAGIIERATKGVYVFNLSKHKGADTLELVARALRRGEFSYVSLESALSEYGVISQIPVGRITLITTGRKGEYRTPYGVIEFTHTKRPLSDILESAVDRGRPLKIATKEAALRDLKRVGRNLHLIDSEEANG